MLTKNEINALSLSPTKKDFVQIWNELLEVAGKLSERWDPTSTNESDPGIVILKALTGIADKLNYNIDKNILEAFMPTAAQEDSMRKLCDMLGYSVKYYRSAETSVNIRYHNNEPSADEERVMDNHGMLAIPKFTVITNSDKDINYFTTNQKPIYISLATPSVKLNCMEGQIVKCESTTDNDVITAEQISENNRFYLPEAQIAENGIFVYNVYSGDGHTLEDGTPWENVDNLNIQAHGSRVFKFGYDSYEGRPYIEFPADYTALINDGLFIYYARTSGANGNISRGILTQLEAPSTPNWDKVSLESFSVENVFDANTGANIETIQQAYNNFKKTIGTFETLVTCRDYMNKIYTMTDEETGQPLVSNVLVTDIRNDLNRAITICSCTDAGIFYKEAPVTKIVTKTLKIKGSTATAEVEIEEPAINHFDLVLYPFKSYTQIKGNVKDIQKRYDSSFKYNAQSFDSRLLDATNLKTIAHNITSPTIGDVVCINNYLRLSAIVSTNSKITEEEGALLKETIKIALANAFNMHELDFGEEIPFESIVEVIENADSRIKMVSLNEPALYTTFSVVEGTERSGKSIVREYAVASNWLTKTDADATGRFEYENVDNSIINTFNTIEAKEIYNKLAVRNILAGRVPLFKYNNTFKTSFSEGAYRTTQVVPEATAKGAGLTAPTSDNPFTLYVNQNSGKTYTGQLTPLEDNEVPEELKAQGEPTSTKTTEYTDETATTVEYLDENGVKHAVNCNADSTFSVKYIGELDTTTNKPVYSKIIYTEISTPETYTNNIIAKDPDDSADVNNITEITTSCKINADGANNISQVTLAAGEFIKFRAPNFITTKTYPAYVNYHLALNKDLLVDAEPAAAKTLFELLNVVDNNGDYKWESVLRYFEGSEYKKTFMLTQTVSNTSSKPIIENTSINVSEETYGSILQKSGCVKVKVNDNGEAKPIIKWVGGAQGGPELSDEVFKALDLADDPSGKHKYKLGNSLVITRAETFDNIKNYVDSVLAELSPEAEDWTISYEFEYVPFESVAAWENFVRDEGETLFGFAPETDVETILWRCYSGNSYAPGKYILPSGVKLLAFTSAYFGLLDNLETRLHGIYIAEHIGRDQKANIIPNNEEYELRTGEYLFIEYTPSATTEDGTTKTLDSVKEIHGPGTIIRPNGFEEGLKDSSAYALEGHTALKTCTFNMPTSGSQNIALHSFGVNEQVEIREPSKVALNKDFIANSDTVYIYKNFNDCEPLEGKPQYELGKRVNSTYTLKDGEYIFYTDKNKAELAYYSAGTDVTLDGDIVLPKFDDIIDIATIFESGLQEIPWYPVSFVGDRGITFQEYQYITLGPGDTLVGLTLDGQQNYIDNKPQDCSNVAYKPVGAADDDRPTPLPRINTANLSSSSSGWKVSSVLELDTSPSFAQTLRKTDKVETSIALHKTNTTLRAAARPIILEAEDAAHPLSFKTNLACQSNNGKVKISELYSNKKNLIKSFELKVFSEEAPIVINTKPGTLIPLQNTGESKDKARTEDRSGELWSQAKIAELTPVGTEYDRALKLAVSILPNTYGIFSVYLDYSGSALAIAKTWLELPPGVSRNTFTLLNVSSAEAAAAWESGRNGGGDRLALKPGINCIRVNNTGNIYIKAAAGSDGVLYFDELRLVDLKDNQIGYGLNLAQIGYFHTDTDNYSDTETQLLADIRKMDIGRDFYYNVPIEPHVAIDFIESDSRLNTLMNPAVNYDINNVNNQFVISKLDINFLTEGIQIARSSRIS